MPAPILTEPATKSPPAASPDKIKTSPVPPDDSELPVESVKEPLRSSLEDADFIDIFPLAPPKPLSIETTPPSPDSDFPALITTPAPSMSLSPPWISTSPALLDELDPDISNRSPASREELPVETNTCPDSAPALSPMLLPVVIRTPPVLSALEPLESAMVPLF